MRDSKMNIELLHCRIAYKTKKDSISKSRRRKQTATKFNTKTIFMNTTKCNMTRQTSSSVNGAGSAYPSGSPAFPDFCGGGCY